MATLRFQLNWSRFYSIMSMARQYDLIVFGASGFTGKYVAAEVARVSNKENITWAVSGRNTDKMKAILENVEKSTGS